MDRVVVHCRRAGLACVALLSVAVGVGAIWVIARPDVIGRLPTSTLFGVVAILVLPFVTAGLLAWDRRTAASGATPQMEHVPAVRFIGDPGTAPVTGRASVPVGRDRGESPDPVHGGVLWEARPHVATHAPDSGRPDPARHRHHRGTVPAQD